MPPVNRFQTGSAAALIFLQAVALGSPETEAGQALAAELRQQRPSEGSTNSAKLRLVDPDGRRKTVPVTITTRVADSQWTIQYEAAPTRGGAGEGVTIVYRDDQSPVYEVVQAGKRSGLLPAGGAFTSFAGSDFWIADLGREFLHWPEQRMVGREPHSGRMCGKLESVNPSTNGYARVISWIDAEYNGLLGAEAYDSQGRLVKRFATGSIQRHGDGYMLKDVKIRDVRKDSLTELEFEQPSRPPPP